VAEAVVEVAQVVEVDDEQAQRPRELTSRAESLEFALEAAHVEKTRLRIPRRLLLERRQALEPVDEEHGSERERRPPGIGREERGEADADRRESGLGDERRPRQLPSRAPAGEVAEESTRTGDDPSLPAH